MAALGDVTALRHSGRRHHGTAAVIGAAIGFYDGILGPGISLDAVLPHHKLLAPRPAQSGKREGADARNRRARKREKRRRGRAKPASADT